MLCDHAQVWQGKLFVSGAGINLDSNGATPFSASSGSISGAAGNAIDINGGSGNITYPGTLGNGAGNTADITNRTGGSISLSVTRGVPSAAAIPATAPFRPPLIRFVCT